MIHCIVNVTKLLQKAFSRSWDTPFSQGNPGLFPPPENRTLRLLQADGFATETVKKTIQVKWGAGAGGPGPGIRTKTVAMGASKMSQESRLSWSHDLPSDISRQVNRPGDDSHEVPPSQPRASWAPTHHLVLQHCHSSSFVSLEQQLSTSIASHFGLAIALQVFFSHQLCHFHPSLVSATRATCQFLSFWQCLRVKACLFHQSSGHYIFRLAFQIK